MRRVVCCLLVCLAIAAPAVAQQKEPIPPFVVDIRGAFARHKAEPSVATDLGVTTANLPARSVGLVGGAHVYPLRGRRVTLGFGGNVVIARGSRDRRLRRSFRAGVLAAASAAVVGDGRK